MTPADLNRVVDSFTTCHTTFAPLFGRVEAQQLDVVEVRSTERVFTSRPATAVPASPGRGRKPQRERRVADTVAPPTVATVAAALPARAWRSFRGAKVRYWCGANWKAAT